MTLAAALEAALEGKASPADVIEAIDQELENEAAEDAYFEAGQPF